MDDHQQIEEIIREIAAKHGVAVSRDDPILILQTINNRLLLDSAKAQQALLDKYKEELEAVASRWGSDAKEKAERILNLSLSASKDMVSQVVEEAGRITAAAMADTIDSSLKAIRDSVQDAHRLAILNVIAACITACAAAIALWAVL